MLELLKLASIALCMAAVAFFAGIETGMISINRLRLRHLVRQGEKRAGILEKFLENSDRLLGTTLVGQNVFLVFASVLAASIGRNLGATAGESAATAVATLLVLIFCEYLPKAWFHGRPIVRSMPCARLLLLAEACLRPLSVSVVWLTRWLIPGKPTTLAETVPLVTRDDLLALARESEEHGVLSREERVMIHRVFGLSSKLARDIMVPRAKMICVPASASLPEFFETARQAGFTRFPVYHPERGEFLGAVNVIFVLTHADANAGKPIEWFVRPSVFVHERTPVDDILPLMRRHRQPLCLVQNDREEVTGMVTTEDILDEVVGQL